MEDRRRAISDRGAATNVLILRGVTDLVDPVTGDPTYHAPGAWERASVAVMASLIRLLGEALPDLAR